VEGKLGWCSGVLGHVVRSGREVGLVQWSTRPRGVRKGQKKNGMSIGFQPRWFFFSFFFFFFLFLFPFKVNSSKV
jgi:hypothetical protein